MLFTISQRFFFDAAHTLRREIEAEGSRRVHGHTYHAEVFLTGPRDPATGMVLDLGLLRQGLAVGEAAVSPLPGAPLAVFTLQSPLAVMGGAPAGGAGAGAGAGAAGAPAPHAV